MPRITRRRSVTIFTSALAALIALVMASAALAVPVGNGDGDPPPHNTAPTARFTITPNPALVTTFTTAVATATTRARPQARVAPAVFDQGSGDIVRFNAGTSTDDHAIVKYQWDLDGNGTFETSGKAVHRRYFAIGRYMVRLRVTDAAGLTSSAVQPLIIHAAPVARLRGGPATVPVNAGIKLDASLSFAPQGNGMTDTITKLEWDLDADGTYETTGTSKVRVTTFSAPGVYPIGLRVTDQYGSTGTTVLAITVAG